MFHIVGEPPLSHAFACAGCQHKFLVLLFFLLVENLQGVLHCGRLGYAAEAETGFFELDALPFPEANLIVSGLQHQHSGVFTGHGYSGAHHLFKP